MGEVVQAIIVYQFLSEGVATIITFLASLEAVSGEGIRTIASGEITFKPTASDQYKHEPSRQAS